MIFADLAFGARRHMNELFVDLFVGAVAEAAQVAALYPIDSLKVGSPADPPQSIVESTLRTLLKLSFFCAGPVPALAAVAAWRAQESRQGPWHTQQREGPVRWRWVRSVTPGWARRRYDHCCRSNIPCAPPLQCLRRWIGGLWRPIYAHIPVTVQASTETECCRRRQPSTSRAVGGTPRLAGASRLLKSMRLIRSILSTQTKQEVSRHPA